jgi:tripartite-type tricarboxylate transporter receptor subunit TctC
MKNVLKTLAVLLLLACGAGASLAQSFPARPLRIIVPVVPGGGLDFIARLLAPKLSESLGQTIVVDNRPGASGVIAMELTARATPDGHNLMVYSATHVIYAAINRTSYDFFRDFAPISQLAASPYVFVVHPQLPARSVAELTAHAKSNPGKLSYASSGAASLQQLAMEYFASTARIQFIHVPYKGIGAAIPDLASGRVHMTMSSLTSMLVHVRAGTLRPLAVTSAQRVATLPQVPTMIEAGVAGFEVTQWTALHAPVGTPRRIVERLSADVARALRDPEVVRRMAADGTDPVGSPPAAFAAFLKAEHAKWSGIARQAGVTGTVR